MKVYLIFRDGGVPSIDAVVSSKKKAENYIAEASEKYGGVWYEGKEVE